MAESEEIRSQRLKAVEDFADQVEEAKNAWRDAKEKLAQNRKDYDKKVDALCGMIRERQSTPLFEGEGGGEE